MRLTKLKLAGFKSFVDPTTVVFPGQLVGVVGPNGCGKSNIMDAVRWVLGESRASELRGESMQDVIFNGTSTRAPVSRAQVELVFDNSQGRSVGQWSQYAELSVKRVLTRAGQSDYLINNLRVRRRDVTDLFLGTGLGPRAYAIIGQGMISRIIEARPEDLRIFLEEAAGVSRYRERRRETEGRIADTRDNLARIEDIRAELATQMHKLEAQAEVARLYQEQHLSLERHQQMLWLLRRNEALTEQQKLAQGVAEAETALHAALAKLRETEAALEALRQQHFEAGDHLHQAQGDLFAVNAEVARLEAEIRHRRESRQQIQGHLARLETEVAHWQGLLEKSTTDQQRWASLRDMTVLRCEEARARREVLSAEMPGLEAALSGAQRQATEAQREKSTLEQRCQIELSSKAHIQRARESLHQRYRLAERERGGLEKPEEAALKDQQHRLSRIQEECREIESAQEKSRQMQVLIQSREAQASELSREGSRKLASLQARYAALEQLQARTPRTDYLGQWVRSLGLEGVPALWQKLRVDPGWEKAVEAVLRENLNALEWSGDHDRLVAQNRPPAAMVLYRKAGDVSTENVAADTKDSLLAKVWLADADSYVDSSLRPLLAAWLRDVRVCASLPEALRQQGNMKPGEVWVTPEGDCVSRETVRFFVPDPQSYGFLARQQEMAALALELKEAQAASLEEEAELETIRAELARIQTVLQHGRETLTRLQADGHRSQLEVVKLEQAAARYAERLAHCEREILALAEEEKQEAARETVSDQNLAMAQAKLVEANQTLQVAQALLQKAEHAAKAGREALSVQERESREAEFALRECTSKLEEIGAAQAQAAEQLGRIASERKEYETRLQPMSGETLEGELQSALERRADAENKLALSREHLDRLTAQLRQMDEQRLICEQGLEPLRGEIGALKLREQAAALSAGQMREQLEEAGADETALLSLFPRARASGVSSEISRLQKAISDLGAVNLAALQELTTARERKSYLDRQAEDLGLALETLENAIRRIDRETRTLLQETFDAVNAHFGRLFPELFGGGRAELLMTGDEILDAGVQVTAQPPGKKNSTIHLLSGGEKALTAIALVFSMFQLNPAPFCLLDEVDAPLDDSNTERFCQMVKRMSAQTQFLFISHNKIAIEMGSQLVGVTMQESGVSRVVDVDVAEAMRMAESA